MFLFVVHFLLKFNSAFGKSLRPDIEGITAYLLTGTFFSEHFIGNSFSGGVVRALGGWRRATS